MNKVKKCVNKVNIEIRVRISYFFFLILWPKSRGRELIHLYAYGATLEAEHLLQDWCQFELAAT